MKKTIVSFFLLTVLLLGMLCACGKKNDVLTVDEAVALVAEHLQIDKDDMEDVYSHIASGENPCYSLHFTYDGKSYSFMVDVVTGEVMESDH